MLRKSLSKDSSIYQYTLIKRVYHHPVIPIICLLMALTAAIILWAIEGGSWITIGLFFVAYVFVHAGHTLWFARLSKSNKVSLSSSWGYVWYYPWQGLVPKTYAPLSFLWKTHLHLFIIGGCICLLTIPWMPNSLSFGLVFFHLALLVPRIIIFALLRRVDRNGIARIAKPHVSLYKS